VNEFTGERVIPGEVEIDLWNEHVSRYALACRYAAGKRVLDVGCGTGYGAADLSRSAAAVTGVDCAEEAIAYAHAHYSLPNVSFLIASALSLPFPSASFDLATAFEVIEHLENWRDLLSEVRRVIRPGGLAIISTPNREYYAASRRLEGPNPFHHHEFAASEFLDELKAFFPYVSLFLQNRTEALTFHPEKAQPGAAAQIEGHGESADAAHFLIAFCSMDEPKCHEPFVYVPRAANILGEREKHIALLEREVAEVRGERDKLHAALNQLEAHLEEKNRWALRLDEELQGARARIVELQNDAAEMRTGYESQIRQLEDENDRKTEWAERVTRELEERTRWALELDARVQALEAQLAMARASRWLKLGRQFKIGPVL
jgi:ubiquinone/menaquinone biosynthesis C-methylase UbiE